MSKYTPTSLEMMAASKVIGRECATTTLAFLTCKKENRHDPAKCLDLGETNYTCGANIILEAKEKFPKPFADMVECMDKNDYRFGDCRAAESAFLGAWNAHRGYKSADADK